LTEERSLLLAEDADSAPYSLHTHSSNNDDNIFEYTHTLNE